MMRHLGILACVAAMFVSTATATAADDPLRAAIEDLTATFGDRYPHGREFLARLDRIDEQLQTATGQQPEQLRAQREALRREALLANPLVSGRPIVFVVRRQYRPDHHNTETMFQTGEINTGSFHGGGAIKTIDLARGGEVRTLLDLPEGVARDLEVSYDGRRILFAMRRNRADDYHLCEMDVEIINHKSEIQSHSNPQSPIPNPHPSKPAPQGDSPIFAGAKIGTVPRQLTFGAGLTDIDPLYLPDGRILFSSSREPKYCMCNRHIMCNLYTMEADGANIQQIGHSTLFEGHPSLLNDGRVIYDRWEYVDRNFGDNQGAWTCNPDGTNHVVYYGAHMTSPGVTLDSRAIPGSEQIVATFSSCHDRPWGAIAVIDRQRGVDGKAAVVRTWPAEAINLIGKGNYDTFTRVNPKYEDPWPLSDKYFLCSRTVGRGEQMGIYLLDVFGNEILLHAEAPGCFDPMPLGPRTKPPVIPSRVDLARDQGNFFVADVYAGTGMDRVPRGTVKSLRVVESPEKRFWTDQNWQGSGTQAPGMAWDDFNNKRILGTVPVEADGSAYFSVPADAFVYFQLLDERGMMVQSMRSGTLVRPGETTGCVGCHENRRHAVPARGGPLATRRPPSPLRPWYGPPRDFNYLTEVQPALDKHCVSCHDYGQEAGKKLNLARDLGLAFNTSYVELRSKGYVKVVGAGPAHVLPPKAWGSHASSLAKVLVAGHQDPAVNEKVRLDPESFDRIVTWIDINAPYYADYAGGAYRGNLYGRSPLAPQQLNELGRLTGMKLSDQRFAAAISFTRPELSSCLEKFGDKGDSQYAAALAIIQAGKDALLRAPRPDMPNCRPQSPIEIEQEAKYQARLKTEAAARAAISAGEKHYERP
jgi:hypothetical protein